MKLGGRERMDDGRALEELFAGLPVNADWTVGFFTAIRTGPDAITPAAWIPEVVRDGALDSDPSAGAKIELLTRLYGAVGETLRTTPEIICPEPELPDQEAVDFCSGYLHGARMHESWRSDETATKNLYPFAALANESGVEIVDAEGKPVADAAAWRITQRERLGSYVAGLHAYWKSKRQVVNTTPKVGRNEPCPCGSGKKHKKCCLAAQA
ncbi:MAG: YecA family protein [Myxococcaceae bacterium]|jgi:uncharacterized protein|nr:YecA family protein [Myxococcaceae bacterium]MEA2746737.1 uncharacterized protein [Myxococcales bacterium]